MKTTHILKTSAGVSVDMAFDEDDASFECQWSPPPPFTAAVRRQVIKEYIPWRNEIIARWSERTGRKVAILTV